MMTEETHLHLIDPGDSDSSSWRKAGPHDSSCPSTLQSLSIFSSPYISNHIPRSQTPLPGHRGSWWLYLPGQPQQSYLFWRASAVRSKTIAVELELWTHLSKSNVVGSCVLTPKEMSCVERNTFIVNARGCRCSKYSSRHFIFIFYMCPVSSFKFYFNSGHYEQIRAG